MVIQQKNVKKQISMQSNTDLCSRNFQDNHAKGINGADPAGSLESFSLVEPFNSHCLIANWSQHCLKVSNLILLDIAQRLQLTIINSEILFSEKKTIYIKTISNILPRKQ